MNYCHEFLKQYHLPVVPNPDTPIFFIGLGLTKVGYNMVKRMMDEGCYVNLGIFPAVPETRTGLRFTITNHHTFADIERLTAKLAHHLSLALKEENRTLLDVQRAFKKTVYFNEDVIAPAVVESEHKKYKIQHETSIQNIPRELWNSLLGNGSFDWNMLELLEKTFKDNTRPENNWGFHYYLIYDEQNKPVLASFFTLVLIKDDMLAPVSVSRQIEIERVQNPYYLCSICLMMGSVLTEGKHLYIDRLRSDWKDIMMLLLDAVWKEQETQKANSINLRDFDADDTEMDDFLRDQGFIKTGLPENNIIENLSWNTTGEFLQQFKAKGRKYIKNEVLKHEQFYDVKIINSPSNNQITTYYQLYRNIKRASCELNMFDLPENFLSNMAQNPNCEIMQLSIKPEYSSAGKSLVVSVTFSFVTNNNNYCGVVIGLDYEYLKTYNIYKQTLYQTIMRANKLKAKKVYLGFTTSSVKQKLGAKSFSKVCYIQGQDQYSRSIINSVANTILGLDIQKTGSPDKSKEGDV